MKLKLTVTAPERTMIVAALVAYGETDLAARIARESRDPADNGPEVEILRRKHVPD